VYSQGFNQSSSGTDKVNATINCHLLTGSIGRPGAGPFPTTGRPNAMGGSDVGALANQLAAHMGFNDPQDIERVAQFWSAARMAGGPGLKAVEGGAVKALWIMGTNPAVSMSDADDVRRVLRRCELLVVSDCVADTDTTRYAHVLLPALGWGEKEGSVTNPERRISRQRAFLEAPGGSARLVDTQSLRRSTRIRGIRLRLAARTLCRARAFARVRERRRAGLSIFPASRSSRLMSTAAWSPYSGQSLPAFSCKARAVCPSCNARRMAETAVHLVDHVFPHQPVRQWVLTLPKRVR
jgi:hypothetical protein